MKFYQEKLQEMKFYEEKHQPEKLSSICKHFFLMVKYIDGILKKLKDP